MECPGLNVKLTAYDKRLNEIRFHILITSYKQEICRGERSLRARPRFGNARVLPTPGPVFSGRKTNASYERTRA